MVHPVHIDRFSAGLDDLTRKEQGDSEAVLTMLRKVKRFSVFEASENRVIARTMTKLMSSGRVTVDHDSVGYPWTLVTHIDGEPL